MSYRSQQQTLVVLTVRNVAIRRRKDSAILCYFRVNTTQYVLFIVRTSVRFVARGSHRVSSASYSRNCHISHELSPEDRGDNFGLGNMTPNKENNSAHICVFFSPRDAMLARVFARATSPSSVCLSVRLSVTHRYCVQTKKASVMISSPSGTPRF